MQQMLLGIFQATCDLQLFRCGVGIKHGCAASLLLFSLYLDELGKSLEEAAPDIDCPQIAELY